MTRDTKKKYLELLSACAVCALTIGPSFAQTTTAPSTKQPGTESTPVEPRTGSGTDTMNRDRSDMRRGQDSSSSAQSSAQVREAQEARKAEGHDPGPIDGVMGPRTKEALRSFQKQEKLQETGRLDSETIQKLGVQVSLRQ
jgi:peptidoglycan hydrolase-like protein with peptidoglycan-binding domain